MTKWNRHLGVYGIYVEDNRLLVVNKTRGPYIYRYDLPGGSLDSDESLEMGLQRELLEEVGESFEIINHLGTSDYVMPWPNIESKQHHIALFYKIERLEPLVINRISADDTAGYDMVDTRFINESNASPLVMDALKLINDDPLSIGAKVLDDWIIKEDDSILHTKRCRILKYNESYNEFYRSLQLDTKIRQYLGGVPSNKHIENNIIKMLNNRECYFIVEFDNNLVGFISLEWHDDYELFELSYEFEPSTWGKGLAYESVNELLKHFDLPIVAITQSKNIKSKALLLRLGLTLKTTKVMFNEEQSIFMTGVDDE